MNFRFQISDFGFEHALGCRAVKFKSGGQMKMTAAFEQWVERADKSEIRNQKSEILA